MGTALLATTLPLLAGPQAVPASLTAVSPAPPSPAHPLSPAVTKYSVRMEYLAAGQAGYLKYEASSTTVRGASRPAS